MAGETDPLAPIFGDDYDECLEALETDADFDAEEENDDEGGDN